MKILYILIFFLSLSCKDTSELDCQIKGGGIENIEIQDTLKLNEEYKLKLIYWKPDPCFVLEKISSTFNDSSVLFKAEICYRRNENTICPSIIVVDTTYKKLIFSKSGMFEVFINDTILVKKVMVI